MGLGYGLSSGYGYGYPGYGYGYANPGYGYGYAYPYSVNGNGAYYGGNGAYYGAGTNAVPSTVVTASATTMADDAATTRSHEFAKRAEVAFKAADYERAVYAWRHAIVDNPQNPILLLQLGQALFAIGKYDESAGATQAAMRQLPKENWGDVIRHYPEMYGKTQDYTRQLKALEKAVNNKPGDPALRFLAGYHFGYLGFLKPSIDQLERGLQNEPRDEIAKQLRDEMESRLGTRKLTPPPPAPAADLAGNTSR